MNLKETYNQDDLKEFDRLLKKTEQKGFNNYARNLGRLELNKWLEQFTKECANQMFEKIKDW
jgi:hypothetical protein